MIELNRFQTPLDEDLQKSLPTQVWSQLIDYVESVKFIQNLIAPENVRGYAKDKPKDKNGRIIVDITKPHILEDMDYFRQPALYFKKHGVYTHLPRNANPKSEYAEFWKEELRRWKYGITRESDGEWIPGSLYFYWNYSQIWLVEKAVDEQGNVIDKKGERKKDFPRPYLGDYLFFHYVDQAMNLGKHGKMLKARGIGASFKFSSMSPRNMYVLPGSGNPNFHLASDSTFLKGDKGIWGKVLDNLDWIGENTPLPRMRLFDRRSDMEIQLGVEDEYGKREGLLSSVFGVSLKDNPDKARGIRGPLIHYEEDGLFPNLEKAWNVNREATEEDGIAYGFMCAAGCVCAGTKVYTNNGIYKNIEDLKQEEGLLGYDVENQLCKPQTISWMQPPAEKECIKIETLYRTLECSEDHPILVRRKHYKNTDKIIGQRKDYYKKLDKWYISNKYKTIAVYEKIWVEAKDIKKGDIVYINEYTDVWGNEKLFDPRLVGMLIGDGSYGVRKHYGKLEFKTPCFSSCDDELNNYIIDNYACSVTLERPTKDGRTYKEISIRDLIPKLKEIGIAGQSKNKKKLPDNYMNLTKEDSKLLIAGLFDTDGCVQFFPKGKKSTSSVSITQSSKVLLEQLKVLLEKFGIFSLINECKPNIQKNRKDKNSWYILNIRDKKSLDNFYENIPLLTEYKKKTLALIYNDTQGKIGNVYKNMSNIREEKIVNTEKIGIKKIYNLTAKENNTYIANGIITHNTGGTEGASFEGSEKLFYNCDAYNIYGILNVFDKNSDGSTTCGFFWGAYLNRGMSNTKENGEPDVIGALIQVLLERKKVADASNDPKALTQKRAESPITPQEAVMRTEGTIFPIADLKDYLGDIMPQLSTFIASHYIGDLVFTPEGLVDFKPNADLHIIREYPLKDNLNKIGGYELFELPKRGNGGVIPKYRYIAGIDPYDDDHSTTTSLGSMFVFDLFTDRIVAEYTGRPLLANVFYENCYRLLKFYNAVALYECDKKGLFTYFSNKNILHYLADAPQILKDMDIVKATNLFGNKAKGFNSGKIVNAWGRRLQADWMLTQAYGEPEGILNLHKIRSIGYIKEAIAWNPDGNFDRISAMTPVMILREEYYKYILQAQENSNAKQVKSLANDSFFDINYNMKGKVSKEILSLVKEKSYNNLSEFN